MQLFGPPDVNKLYNDGNVAGLIKALRYQKDKSIRFNAAAKLGQLHHVKKGSMLSAVGPLISALDDDYVRVTAASSLGEIVGRSGWAGTKDSDIAKVLNGLVNSYKRYGDWQLLKTIGDFNKLAATDALAHIYENENGDIKYAALRGLGNIVNLRATEQWEVATAKAAGVHVIDFSSLSYKGQEIHQARDEARHKKAVDILVSALSSNNKQGWITAAFALGVMGDKRAEDKLISLLHDDSNRHLSLHAARALYIGGLRKTLDEAKLPDMDRDEIKLETDLPFLGKG